MEGPSLYLAAEQLKPFKKKKVLAVAGNTSIEKERMSGKEVRDIFAWGKHLVFQFDTFALRVHFLLFGTFEAQVDTVWVTGDYRRTRTPRLSLTFNNGVIHIFNGSIKFIESPRAKQDYDFSIDIMSPKWDAAKTLKNMRTMPNEEIADVLLDQTIFAGVGNIIKNEVLFMMFVNPTEKIAAISPTKLKKIIIKTHTFSKQFFRWRKKFELVKHLKAHRKGVCPHCGKKMVREKTGKRMRWAYWCPVDQALRAEIKQDRYIRKMSSRL
jgi:endonuclease-8